MATISINLEISEALYDEYQRFIETHNQWDAERFGASAIALFLMQHGVNAREVNKTYLDNLFGVES